jgi:glycosyltransferase involved in cell wall biosynthesis
VNNKIERRIAIFEYDWSMYSFIKDLIIRLAEKGYQVDIFHKSPGDRLDSTIAEQFKQYSNVRYFNLKTSNSIPQIIFRKYKGLLRRLNWNYKQNPKNIINREILQKSIQITMDSKYTCFIGIEKKGLIWAGILSEIYKCPLIYYSLELYLEDHPEIKIYSFLRKAEKKYHQNSGATIIQDRLRAKALLKFNEIGSTNLLYLPISVRGNIVKKRDDYIHQKFNINCKKKLLLYFGLIDARRFSSDLVRIANYLDDDVKLVLHGYGNQTFVKKLQSSANPDRVIFSLEFVSEEKIQNVISSADIGLALYELTNSNERLTAFSSVKVAYYLQCGVPIIAFNSESYRELMSTYKCGELIDSIDEIPQSVEKILNQYNKYREQAFLAFKRFYDFDNNFNEFIRNFENYLKNN